MSRHYVESESAMAWVPARPNRLSGRGWPREFLEKFGLSCEARKLKKKRIWDTHHTVATRFNETPLLTAYTPIASG